MPQDCLPRLKGLLARCAGAMLRRNRVISAGVKINGSLTIHGRGRVVIGRGCLFNQRNRIRALEGSALTIGERCQMHDIRIVCHDAISIGNRCLFGPECIIRDGDGHSLDPRNRGDSALEQRAPVRIGDDCWIGDRAIILKGVTVGEGSTIGAGSVVTRSIPPHSVAAGNPATVIRSLSGAAGEPRERDA